MLEVKSNNQFVQVIKDGTLKSFVLSELFFYRGDSTLYIKMRDNTSGFEEKFGNVIINGVYLTDSNYLELINSIGITSIDNNTSIENIPMVYIQRRGDDVWMFIDGDINKFLTKSPSIEVYRLRKTFPYTNPDNKPWLSIFNKDIYENKWVYPKKLSGIGGRVNLPINENTKIREWFNSGIKVGDLAKMFLEYKGDYVYILHSGAKGYHINTNLNQQVKASMSIGFSFTFVDENNKFNHGNVTQTLVDVIKLPDNNNLEGLGGYEQLIKCLRLYRR